MNILAQIVESKKREIEALYKRYDLRELQSGCGKSGSTAFRPSRLAPFTMQRCNNKGVNALCADGLKAELPIVPHPLVPPFYQRLAEARAANKPFFITEFKRKSPSEGWIHQDADLPTQILAYTQAGASAISILTDAPFFGGSYDDLNRARSIVNNQKSKVAPPLLLQKDFILDPLQIYLAKLHGADLILLIAAILEPEQLDDLRKTAESIGLGVLVEVHDVEELEKIQYLDFQVLGINNRDLKTFRTSLNRVNTLTNQAVGRFVIAESGVLDYRHFQMVKNADGFLIGTGLMRESKEGKAFSLTEHFQSQGRLLLKACGIRTAEMLQSLTGLSGQTTDPDFIGINFSPLSKRRADAQTCEVLKTSQVSGAVAVFYKNTETEIRETLQKYPFKTIQLYAGDVSPEFVRSLKIRVILAVKVSDRLPWSETIATLIHPYAADVDCFILDGANPGSGERIGTEIPADFPYPFLLAGGLHESNLEAVLAYKNCIGVDIASGIETEGAIDLIKIGQIAQGLVALSLPHDIPDRL